MTKGVKGFQKGDKHPKWKGDKAIGYNVMHGWVSRNFIKPGLCEQWHIKSSYDWANVSGEYHRDKSDWLALCRRCHMDSDGRMKNLKRGNSMVGKKNPMFGKRHSEETKQKIRLHKKDFGQVCQCGSKYIIRNGGIKNDNQWFQYKDYKRYWSIPLQNLKPIVPENYRRYRKMKII